MAPDRIGPALAHEFIGVLTARQHGDADVKAVGKKDLRATQRSRCTGRIPVIQDGGVGGVAPQQAGMLFGHGRARGGHHLLDAGHMQADQISVALDNHDTVGLAYRLAGEVEAIEDVALLIDPGLGRVDVLGRVVLNDPARSEGDHLLAQGVDGESDAPAETVVDLAILFPDRQSGLDQQIGIERFGAGVLEQSVPFVQAVADMEAGKGFRGQPA
ncbi:MAG: hypothetical protein BWY77_01588 [bacterium ADurb.Bin431]|nr:MAG: hypothetical protein BWY77_01588 [bacterium ADurb.Bin431]